MRTFLALILAGLMLATPDMLQACEWDYDTIAMERERFPEAHELIAGLFVRHSPAHYEWRIEDREQTPLAQRTPADYDDIAVSYDKLGRQDEAIATIRAKMERWPDEGRYESHANLGTFHIHAGELEAGLEHIEKAIEINPEAHFGREIYQKLLVEYVLMVRAGEGESTLPLRDQAVFGFEAWDQSDEDAQGRPSYAESFSLFVLHMQGTDRADRDVELARAVKGILGMMRFGNYDSPILLEALGDLMLAVGLGVDAKMLASRAYLKASYETEGDASAAYRVLAEEALEMQRGVTLAQVEADLKKEIAQGDAFFAEIEADQRAWAAAGKDLDAEFAAKYYKAPALDVAQAGGKPGRLSHLTASKVVFVIPFLLIAGAMVALLWFFHRKRRGSAVTA
ncbi:hypothetical protein OT109_00535 [Phycisphaeraceae bacterium D3-23]